MPSKGEVTLKLQPRKLLERLEILTLQVEDSLSAERLEELRAVVNEREAVLKEILELDSLSHEEVAHLIQLQEDQTRVFNRMKAEHAELERGLIQIHASRHGRRAYRRSA